MEFTDEQRMLGDSVAGYLRDHYSFEKRQAVVAGNDYFSDTHWQQFAEMGWLAMTLPEAQGGFGCGAVETMIMCEEMGRNLVIEPFLETVTLTGGLLQQGGTAEQLDTYLTPIGEGALQGAFAHGEKSVQPALATVNTVAQASAGGFEINGTKTVVCNGAAADFFVVSARTSDVSTQRSGVTLFLVDGSADGVIRRSYPTHDGRQACDLTLENVRVAGSAVLGEVDHAERVLDPVADMALLASCAESLGAMDALMEGTLDYTRQRTQFGRSLSEFQVLRHRMADMFIHIEMTRSLVLAVATALDQGPGQASALVAALKARTVQAGRFVSQNAIQLHGGIAMTDALRTGHYFKRLSALESWFGSRDFHLQRFSECTAEGSAS